MACADIPTGLNDCLEAYNYHLSSLEDIFAKLSSCKVFSKLDFSVAYLQIPVDEECANYLTINTPKSLYRFDRLTFSKFWIRYRMT